ncbi:putative THUMP domain-containing protein 1 [Lucilia cuprina]|uniref:Putative THUMP domain-containing protein 1 n=1 Tax=Lucilia cuprina TaxID=7375 RepID=A0A0L0C493_LUCCU|nr:THUMP domain-containing protein 1 like protein [Lucilia cuprina]KNC26289.1 putative THUMP domain-containing protein 1 [Lucilia cuprina]
MSEPPAKKQKFQYKKKFYQPNRKQYLEVGHKGFLATCNFNEKDCVRECYNILNQYANDLYGPEEDEHTKVSNEQIADKTEEANEEQATDDIADVLQKQIDATQLKNKTPGKRRFQAVDTGASNCVFIKTTLDDPVAMAGHIVKDIAATKQQKTRHLLRLVPIDAVCKANDKDIVNTAGQLCDKYFLKEPTTFSIVFNKRFNNDINRDQMIREIADLIHAKNIKNKVDLKHAKRSLVVEVIKGLCCLSVVDDYMAMKKYNLVELARANQEYNKDDKKQDTTTSEEKTDVEESSTKLEEKEEQAKNNETSANEEHVNKT